MNQRPQVTAAFDGLSSCHPTVSAPCNVGVHAEASDPDGDTLTYSWSGCASGSGPGAVCTISAPGGTRATVTVSDGRGGMATTSLDAYGSNAVPYVEMQAYPPFLVNQNAFVYGNVFDPDDGFVCGRQWCVRAEPAGACGPDVFFQCTCLAGVEIELRPHSTGTCKVVVTVRDEWGLEGRSSVQFEVR